MYALLKREQGMRSRSITFLQAVFGVNEPNYAFNPLGSNFATQYDTK
jgi:hypothetical protein